jgi:hypothetical protein
VLQPDAGTRFWATVPGRRRTAGRLSRRDVICCGSRTLTSPRTGWLYVGHKGGKWREIDLVRQVREPLAAYLQHVTIYQPYVFTSQRCALTEAGIHHRFRRLKAQARQNGRSSPMSPSMICATTSPTAPTAGWSWRRWPITWAITAGT